MKNIYLSRLFEEVMNDVINTTHYLKQLVDKYKHARVGANPLILDSDFNVMFDISQKANPNEFRFLQQIAAGSKAYTPLPFNNPFERVFNFYQNSVRQISDTPQLANIKLKTRTSISSSERQLIEEAIAELVELAEKALRAPKKEEPKPKTGPVINFSLSTTKYLQDYAYIKMDDGTIDYLNDHDFYTFADLNNPDIENIYRAILNNDESLKVTLNTPENKVYYLWTRLKKKCLDTMINYVKIVNLSGQGSAAIKNNTYNKELVATPEINLNSLTEWSLVGISYKLVTKANNKEIESVVDGVFDFHKRTHGYRLVNRDKKYLSFEIAYNLSHGVVHVGEKYNVQFFVGKEESDWATILITDLKSNNVNSFAQVQECNAADELKKLVYNIRTNE